MAKRNFIKYPSLENHYNVVKSRKLMSVLDTVFYATEKIHGSNMSIEITKDTIRYFSRNNEVKLDETGLGQSLASATNTELIVNIVKEKMISDKIKKIIVFGELYGAGIQKMKYKENLENRKQFRLFDVFVFEDEKAYTLPLEDLVFLFGLSLMAPYRTEYKTLREWLTTELPKESSLGGPIEGLVYKPLEGQVLTFDEENGSINNYLGVKHKTLEFAEIKKQKAPKKAVEYTSDGVNFKYDVERYFTTQRLDNLISKGDFELTTNNLGKIIPAYLSDVKEDYLKDNGENAYFNDKIFNKMAGNVAKLVKDKLQEEIDSL